MVLQNVTGWSELMQGDIAAAAFQALNVPLGGTLIFILYLLISLVLWVKTQSIELCTIISFIFLGVFLTTPWFNDQTIGLAIIITAFQLGATFFKLVAKEKNIG